MKHLFFISFFLYLTVLLNGQNKVINYDGVDDRISIISPATGNADFTAEIWFTGNNGANPRASILSWGSQNGNMNRFIILSNNNKLRLIDDYYNAGMSYVEPFAFDIDDDNKWHHLAVVKADNVVTVYLDNAQPYSYITSMVNPFNLLSDLGLGRPSNAAWPSWEGRFDELRIWDHARSQTEILATRNCLLEGNESGLLLYYDFEAPYSAGGSDFIPDMTSFNNDGELENFRTPIVDEDIGVNNLCNGGLVCETSYSIERAPCSSTYTFTADEKDDGAQYDWVVTTNTGEMESFTNDVLTYTFDWRFIGEDNSYDVCLVVTFQDGCEAEYCETYNFITQQQDDGDHYEVLSEPIDITVDADPESCTALVPQSAPDINVCAGSNVLNTYTRSDGLTISAPYEIGTTVVSVFSEIENPLTVLQPILTFSYEVYVETAEDCCDDEMILEESLIPNPGFEVVTCEPTSFSGLNCAESWVQATDATSDLFGTSFTGNLGGIGLIPPPPNNSDHWVGAIIDFGMGYVEYVGACLLEPLEANIGYTFELYIGTPADDQFGGAYIGDFVILGIPACSLPLSGTDCKEDDYEVIGRASLDLQAGMWTQDRVSIEIMASQQYDAIIFGPSCVPAPTGQGPKNSFYLVFDDLIVIEGEPCDSPEPSDCFTIQSSEITCNDDLTYDVSIQIKNDNDEVFDRLLMFSQSNATAVNPTISIEFGEGQDVLMPGDTSGRIEFTVRQRDYVDEEIEVCFDVIPQNPEGGDCCKDDFCITLPVCCPPDESKNLVLVQDEEDECCYDLSISNNCATNYFTAISTYPTVEGVTISSVESYGEWSSFAHNDGSVSFFYDNGVDSERMDFIPIYGDPITIGTVCIEGVTDSTEESQAIQADWLNLDGENNEMVACSESYETACPADPCNLIFNPFVYCDEAGNYHLDFSMQISNTETHDTRQIVIGPHNGTTVDQYSPQSFDDLLLEPGDDANFTIDLFNVEAGDQFTFSVTLHDFDTPLEDGSYWCCYTGEQVTVNIPPCNPGGAEPGNEPDPIGHPQPISYVVYPNPVRDDMTLAFEKPLKQELTMELISIHGEILEVMRIPEESDRYRLPLADMLSSIYFLRMKRNGVTVGEKKILKL